MDTTFPLVVVKLITRSGSSKPFDARAAALRINVSFKFRRKVVMEGVSAIKLTGSRSVAAEVIGS